MVPSCDVFGANSSETIRMTSNLIRFTDVLYASGYREKNVKLLEIIVSQRIERSPAGEVRSG